MIVSKKLRRQRELPTPIEKIYKFINILTGLQKISTAFWQFLFWFEKIQRRNGSLKTKNLKRLLNLNFTDVTNKTHSVGEYDLLYIAAKITKYPDYIALYKDKGDYLRTDRTCISFYNYDNAFDGLGGIWNAIYYDVAEWKDFYRERFAGVKYFIAPDYSLCGDINKIENLHRLFRARIVSIWLTLELNAVVIPNITYSNEEIFPNMLDGMENCEVVAFSTKGLRNNGKRLSLMKKALRYTVDNLPKLRTIIIYTLSKDDEKIYSWFSYAAQHDIKLIIPSNRSRRRV